MGSCEPDIAPVLPQPIRMPGMPSSEADDSDDSDDSDDEDEDEPAHVSMEVGLGVFDVGGSSNPLLQSGVQEAAGCLPTEATNDRGEDESGAKALIQEISTSGTPSHDPV